MTIFNAFKPLLLIAFLIAMLFFAFCSQSCTSRTLEYRGDGSGNEVACGGVLFGPGPFQP